MKVPNYVVPLNFGKVLEGGKLEQCGVEASIRLNLRLIILTHFGEHRIDHTFGCEVWDLDFELIASEDLWAEKLRKSMLRSVSSHEKRLGNITLAVATRDIIRRNAYKEFTELRKKVEIHITGLVQKSGEDFRYSMDLYLSPLSVDR